MKIIKNIFTKFDCYETVKIKKAIERTHKQKTKKNPKEGHKIYESIQNFTNKKQYQQKPRKIYEYCTWATYPITSEYIRGITLHKFIRGFHTNVGRVTNR